MNPLVGKSLSMIVKHSGLAPSGNWYVRYRADVTLTQNRAIHVVVESTHLNHATTDDVESAKGAIRQGCEEVLGPRGIGAHVVINDLSIHPVDFKPQEFARWTAFHLEHHLCASEIDS